MCIRSFDDESKNSPMHSTLPLRYQPVSQRLSYRRRGSKEDEQCTQTISVLNAMRISTCASDLLMMKVRIHQCTQHYHSVTNLYLKDYHIGEEGAKELSSALKQYQYLTL